MVPKDTLMCVDPVVLKNQQQRLACILELGKFLNASAKRWKLQCQPEGARR